MAPPFARPLASSAEPQTACIHQLIRRNLPLTTSAQVSDQ
jgi:hypothetical protein